MTKRGRVGLGTQRQRDSLLQGLHSHFLILQLLLHLGQLLLQSGELRTQGRATGYHDTQWVPSSHHHHRLKKLSHDYSHGGMLGCVYTEVHTCACTSPSQHSGSHTKEFSHGESEFSIGKIHLNMAVTRLFMISSVLLDV